MSRSKKNFPIESREILPSDEALTLSRISKDLPTKIKIKNKRMIPCSVNKYRQPNTKHQKNNQLLFKSH